jgi:hypothetical protein
MTQLNRYTFSSGDYDGIQFILTCIHTDEFSMDEFQDICEECILETIERDCEKNPTYAGTAARVLEARYMMDALEGRGFKIGNTDSAGYMYNGYDPDGVRNTKLLEILNDKKL